MESLVEVAAVFWSVGIYHYVNADIPTTILLFFFLGLAYHMFAFFPLVAMLERPTEFNVGSVSEPKKKLSTFQASAAEAELDMLLDSFSETKLLDSSGFTFAAAPVHQKEASVHLPQHTRNTLGSLKSSPLSAKLDDGLDDVQFIRQKGSYQLTQVTTANREIQSSSFQPVTKSKVLDDFDSWLDTV